MSAAATPYGLKPVNLIGSQSFNGGAIREYLMTTNYATAIYSGDIIALGVAAAGQPTSITATPTTATRGLVGVCVGVRYVDPTLKQLQFSQFLPAGAVTAGYTQIYIRVCEDPDQLYQVQATAAVTRASIGKNAPLGNFGGSTTTGNATTSLTAASIANTATLAVRIVDLVNSASTFGGDLSDPGDAFTDCIVKLNFGVHSYYQADGSTN